MPCWPAWPSRYPANRLPEALVGCDRRKAGNLPPLSAKMRPAHRGASRRSTCLSCSSETFPMARKNRRQFLEDSMFAAAAAAMAGAPARLLGQDEPQSKSPNERLNVAVVGVNGRGGSHYGFFAARKDTTVTYVVDVDHKI